MSKISSEIIERIRQLVPIEDIISEFVQLKRKGTSLMGLCPFHTEKTPSFSVHPVKQIFHCFGCGASGNVFTFIMKINNMNFPEAVRYLAKKAGITIPEDMESSAEDIERQNIFNINEKALFFFNFYLINKKEAAACREYLKKRGFIDADSKLDTNFIQHWGIGYAPATWDSLVKYLKESSFSEELAIKAGLVRKSSKDRLIDYFRDRLMIPIKDINHHVVGFGGRIIPRTNQSEKNTDEIGPKYLNSPETLVFHKSEILYGLDEAKVSVKEEDEIIIVEGYFDVIMLHFKGIKNVVAPLGTALTKEHISLISRYTRNILLVFDPDSAGEKATLRTIDLLLEGKFKVKILRLPVKVDPCDYVLNNGKEAFLELKKRSPDVFSYMIQNLKERFDIHSLSGKMKILSYIFKYVQKLDSEVEREIVFKLIGGELDISPDAISIEFKKLSNSSSSEIKDTIIKKEPELARRVTFEQEFILLLLIHGDKLKEVMKVLSPEDLKDPVSKRIFENLIKQYNEGIEPDLHSFLANSNDSESVSIITKIIVSEKFGTGQGTLEEQRKNTEKLFNDYLKKIQIYKLNKTILIIKEKIKKATPDEVIELQKDLLLAIRMKHNLQKK